MICCLCCAHGPVAVEASVSRSAVYPGTSLSPIYPYLHLYTLTYIYIPLLTSLYPYLHLYTLTYMYVHLNLSTVLKQQFCHCLPLAHSSVCWGPNTNERLVYSSSKYSKHGIISRPPLLPVQVKLYKSMHKLLTSAERQ